MKPQYCIVINEVLLQPCQNTIKRTSATVCFHGDPSHSPGSRGIRGVVQLCQLQSGEQAAGGISVWTGSSGCRQQCQTQDTALAQLLKAPLVSTSSHLMQRGASGWALSLGYVRMFRLVQRKVWNGEVTGECVN